MKEKNQTEFRLHSPFPFRFLNQSLNDPEIRSSYLFNDFRDRFYQSLFFCDNQDSQCPG